MLPYCYDESLFCTDGFTEITFLLFQQWSNSEQ